jgi:hypothetical protein
MENQKIENKTYPDWDNVIMQINQGDTVVLNLRMMRQDLEAMMHNEGVDREYVLGLMLAALEDQVANPVEPETED